MFKDRRQKILLIAALILTFTATATAGFALGFRPQQKQPRTETGQTEKLLPAQAQQDHPVISPANPQTQPQARPVFASTTPYGVPILMYHHVGILPPNPDPTRIGLTVSPQNFAEQVKWLKDNGYASVTLQELYDHLGKRTTSWPTKPVILTFDDGYEDVFTNAIPVLEKYGYTGAFGIITQFQGTTNGTNVYASWQEIADAKEQGMEIICHTQNHFDGSNPKFDSSYIYQNLSGCQQDISAHVGSTEPFLIYPYGHYTKMYLEQEQKLGFTMAMTTHEGLANEKDGLLTLPRVRISPSTSIEKFQEMITGIFVHTATGSPGLYVK